MKVIHILLAIMLPSTALADQLKIAGEAVRLDSSNIAKSGFCVSMVPFDGDGYGIKIAAPKRSKGRDFYLFTIFDFWRQNMEVSPKVIRGSHRIWVHVREPALPEIQITATYARKGAEPVFYHFDIPSLLTTQVVAEGSRGCDA